MKFRALIASLGLVAACAAPAQGAGDVTVTVVNNVVTVSPERYQLANGQTTFTVALTTRGYVFSGIEFLAGSSLFSCSLQEGGLSYNCVTTQKVPGGEARYKVSVIRKGVTSQSDPAIWIQGE